MVGIAVHFVLAIPHHRALSLFCPDHGRRKGFGALFRPSLVSFFQNQNALAAVIFGAIFYSIILIKDLIIIDRRSAYEILMLVLSYLLIRSFFIKAGGAIDWRTIIYGRSRLGGERASSESFVKNFSATVRRSRWTRPARGGSFRRMLGWMMFLLMWQLFISRAFSPARLSLSVRDRLPDRRS